MIEEIIYTSAAKGLKQGSRGFCTVVSTAGMGANMAERLESMSGYRHAFPLNDPKAVLNPVPRKQEKQLNNGLAARPPSRPRTPRTCQILAIPF